MPKPLNLIVACSENRVIGCGGRLPWRIPEDWQYFRRQTSGATVVLGRISFESWRSVLEDGRNAVVLTRNHALARPGVQVAQSLADALALAEVAPGPVYICGGQRVFEEALVLPEVTRLYLTLIHAHVEGDRTFPDWTKEFPRVVQNRESSDENYRYAFRILERA